MVKQLGSVGKTVGWNNWMIVINGCPYQLAFYSLVNQFPFLRASWCPSFARRYMKVYDNFSHKSLPGDETFLNPNIIILRE